MLRWYALNTKPQSEARVARALMARNYEIFLPLLPTAADERIQPLFPSYLFVRCDLEVVSVASLQWIPGLRRIVSFDGRPAVVPDAAIALIRSRLRQIEEQGGLPTHNFKPGDEVVIDEGPLAGLRGIFQGPLGPAERVQILIRFLGEVNRAEVPVAILRPAAAEPERPFRYRGTRGHQRRINYHERADDAATSSPDLVTSPSS
ncbi:MAG: transcription termination/antitermination protein NusG [Anaerolineae bacterium]